MRVPSLLWLALLAQLPLHAQSLIDIDFGVGSRSPKTGLAATGRGTNDFWNLYRHYDPKFVPGMPLVSEGLLANLKFADGTDSKVSVAVTNAPGVWGNATGDPMYDSYIFAQNGSNIIVAIHHLEPARYHFYLYGHADADVSGEQNSVFTLRSGTNTFGPTSARRDPSPWPHPFVVFRDVEVRAGEPVMIEAAAGANGIPVLNGMQIISRGTSPPRFISHAAIPLAPFTNIIFKEIQYQGKVNETEARFAVTLDVESLATNEISGPLFEGDVAVIAPEIPEGLRLVSGVKQYRLIAVRPGSFRVKFDLAAKITKAEPWNQINFTGPPAAIARVRAEAPAGVEVNYLSGVDGFLGSERNVHLRWQSKTAEVARKSLVTVDTAATAMVTPTVIKYTTQFRYEILQAGITKLTIALPPSHAVTRVQGEQIRDWQIEDGRLTIEFTKPAEKSYTLALHTEQTVESTPATLSLELPQPLNIERESGALNIAADDMTVTVATAAGLRQVNAPREAVAGFRFYGRPFELTANVRRIEPVVKVADRVSARLEERRLLVSHALSLTVEKAGIYAVALAPQTGFVVADVKGDGIDEWKVTDGILRVNFSSRVLGTRSINVSLEQAQTNFPPQFTLLPLRVAGATNETAQVGAGAALGIRLKTGSPISGLREIPVSAGTDQTLAFRSEQPDWRLTVNAERLPARIVAEVFNLITIGDGLVGGSATIRYGIINQGAQEFRVRLPAHWRNIEFTGPNIRRKEMDTNTGLWAVTLQDKAWGGYTLVITYDYQFDPKKATLDLAGAHAVDVERESGSLAVTTAASLKLQGKGVADPLRVIDQSELAEVDRGLITRPVLLAYRYTGPTFGLALDVTRYDEVAVLNAVADRTQLTSVLTEEGQMVTQASFMVKNNDKQYQKFRLPAGANLWGCYVNDQPVKGELDGEWLAVSLPRGANRDQAFGVDIVYAQKFDALRAAALPRTMALAAPRTDVPNTYAEWHLYVPASRRLSGFTGNMDVAGGTTYGLIDGWRRFVAFYANIAQGILVLLGATLLLVVAAVIGMKRRGWNGFITALGILLVCGIMISMLLPLLESRQQLEQSVAQPATPAQAAARPDDFGVLNGALEVRQRAGLAAEPRVAGIRSIHIDLPKVGRPFTFTKVMNVTDEALSVKVSVMKQKWFVVWRSMLQFAAFAAGLILLWREWRRSSFRSALGLALSLGAIGSLLVSIRALHIALIVAAPALLMGAVGWLLWKYWPRRQPGGQGAAVPEMAVIALGFFISLGADAKEPVTNAYSILSAQYTGAVQSNSAQFQAAIRVSTFATNQTIPLFGEDVAIQEFNTSTADVRLMRQGSGISLRVGPQGEALLHFKLAAKLGGDSAQRQVAFAIPPALASKLSLSIDEADADLEFPTAVSLRRTVAQNQTQVDAILGSGDRVDLRWTARTKRITDMAASIFAQQAALITIDNGGVNTRAAFDYQVTQGELRQAKVAIPKDQRLLRVEGEWIRTWEIAEENGEQVLVVELLKGAAPGYRLTVETARLIQALPITVGLVLPRALNVIRETGLVGVRGSEDVALSLENIRDLQRVDAAEFAKAYGGESGDVANAFRFLKPGFALSARAELALPQIEAVVRNAFHVGFEQADLAATIDYTIKRAGVFALRLAVPTDFRLETITGASNVLHWVTQDKPGMIEVTLKSRTIGTYSLSVHMTRLHADLPRALELAGVTPSEVQKVTGFVSVTAETGIALKTSGFAQLLEVPAPTVGRAASSSPVLLAFKQLAPNWNLALATETVDSWVRAEIVNIISVSETLLVGRAVARYDIQNAPVKEFRLKVPPAWRNVEVLGANIRERDESNGVWRVELQNKVRGSFQLAVTFEQPIDTKTNSLLALVGLEALGVERETGSLVVLTRPPLQVVERSASEQLLKIDARELPDWAGVSPLSEVVLVYRYLRSGFQLVCDARRFEHAAVLQALVESAVLTTVVADDGQVMTEMALRIRNNGLQHLEIELPPQTRVWSAFVAGQPVRPAQRGGRLLLPIDRSGAQDAPVPVELTYVGMEPFPRNRGRVALDSPRLDVPLKNARWDIYLPPEYDYAKFAGTMTHEGGASGISPTVYSSSEYARQEVARKDAKESQVRSQLARAKRLLSTGKVTDANRDFNSARENALVADTETKRELDEFKRDLDRAQSSNLIQAQRAYTIDNFRKANAADGPAVSAGGEAGGVALQLEEEKAAKLVEYDDKVAQRQWEVLQKAQEVTVAKAQPLRVNLPTRGLRHTFTQALQTEVNKPMTIEFRASNTQQLGWGSITLNVVAGFLLLWLLTAVASRRPAESA